jgi:hypothetical protein
MVTKSLDDNENQFIFLPSPGLVLNYESPIGLKYCSEIYSSDYLLANMIAHVVHSRERMRGPVLTVQLKPSPPA